MRSTETRESIEMSYKKTRNRNRRLWCRGSLKSVLSVHLAQFHTVAPNLRLIHLPVHASWLNQIEIYFSVVQRKVLAPNDFADLDKLAERLVAFQGGYE